MKSTNHTIEKELREKLAAREIQPSAAAWDRLDAMLTVAEGQKQVRKLNWLYIAAGFIGFILMATIFYQSAKQNSPGNKIAVEKATSIQEKKPINPVIELPVKSQESVAESSYIEEPVQKVNKPMTPQTKSINLPQAKINEATAYVSEGAVKSDDKSPHAIKQAIADIPVTDIDALLATVERNSPKQAKPSIKIDANSLLSQVDGELDNTFREKVIKSVKNNYKTVKVALANRNNR